MKKVVASLVFMLAGAVSSLADVNLIQNPNFLGASGLYDTETGTGIPSWIVGAGTNVDWIGAYWKAPSATGGYGAYGSVDLDGSNSAGSVSQSITTTVGQMYTLSFYAGANPDGPPEPKNLQVAVSDATPESETYNPSYPPSVETGGLLAWTKETYLFKAGSTSTTITFASLDTSAEAAGSVSYGPVVAGVSVVAPEPGLCVALGLGLIGFAVAGKLRRKSL